MHTLGQLAALGVLGVPGVLGVLGVRGARGEQSAQRRQHRVGAGGQDQPAVSDHRAVRADRGARRAVDAGDPGPGQPCGRRQGDHLGAVASGRHLGEQHPVVRAVLLLAGQRHRRAELAEPSGETYAREAGAEPSAGAGAGVRRLNLRKRSSRWTAQLSGP
ncbi:hypothetical protein ACVW19_002066 [Streptomyces sp. TE5632]